MTRQEVIAWAATATFVVAVAAISVLSEGRFLSGTLEFLRGLENSDAQASRNPATNCRDPRNTNLPYCVERRGKVESDWQSITRNQSGKTNAFSLNRNE